MTPRRYRPRALSHGGQMIASAFALFFIVGLLFVVAPLIAEGLAR